MGASLAKLGSAFSDRRLELYSASLLALAALATAWGGYQASRWGGTLTRANSRSSSLGQCVTRASTAALQKRTADLVLYVSWLTAYADSNKELAEFYQRRFRSEFVPAFSAWIALRPRYNADAPSGPFAMREYRVAEDSIAERCERQHVQAASAADYANDMTDYYTFATVIFAVVLFFGTATHSVKSRGVRIALLGIAFVAFVLGLVYLTHLPALPRVPLVPT